jgi:hypothetical protein
MKKLFILFVFNIIFFIHEECYSQTWVQIPFTFNGPVYTLYADSVTNTLYIGGSFTYVDGDNIFSVIGYNGTDTVHVSGLRYRAFVNGAYIYELIQYQNRLFATGNFDETLDKPDSMNSIAQWNGSEWDSVYNPPPNIGGGSGLNVIDDTLYISGLFNSLSHFECGGVMAYHNNQKVKCYGNFPDTTAHYINGVIKYNNNLYAYGHILSLHDVDQLGICQWNPVAQTWERVGNAFTGDQSSSVTAAVIYQGQLYISGNFPQSANVAGNYIMSWDGNAWHDVAGGTDEYIEDMVVHNGLLYVSGAFQHAGNIATDNIAAFDGTNWYALNDTPFNASIGSLAFYNNELYAGGDFRFYGNDTLTYPYLVKYNLPLLNNIEQEAKASLSIHLYPNPATNTLQLINLPQQTQNLTYSIANTLGQIITTNTLPSGKTQNEVDISGLAAGMYFIRVAGSDGYMQVGKFVKQ